MTKLMISSASKPAAGFIEILLAPKKEKFKSWVERREVEARLSSEDFSLILSRYIEKTVEKVSRLSTLVFPQQKIHISDIYEPIEFYVIGLGHKKEDLYRGNSSLKFFNDDSVSIKVLDAAGVGKSTFLKNLTVNLCTEGVKIPIFFELSIYNYDLSLIDNLIQSISSFNEIIDKKVFLKMLSDGWFVVILDGFDEIQIGSQRKVGNEINELSLNKGKSSLILSSRPQDFIPALFSERAISLCKLNLNQTKNILKRYDKISLNKIYSKMIRELERVPARFLEIPLLVGLLYRTYAYNNSIADSISVFYSELYEALYKGHDLTKHGLVREKKSELDIDTFRKLLRVISFNFIFSNTENFFDDSAFISLISESASLVSKKPKSSSDYFSDILDAVPLILKEGISYKFMHRTIPEYFSAEFINNQNNSSDLLRRIFENENWRSSNQVLDFFYEVNQNIYNSVITSKYALDYISIFDKNKNEPLSTLLFTLDLDFSYWSYEDLINHYEEIGEVVDENNMELPTLSLDYESSDYRAVYTSEFTVLNKKYLYSIGNKKNVDLPNPVAKEILAEYLLDDLDDDYALFVVENFKEQKCINLCNSLLSEKVNFSKFNNFILSTMRKISIKRSQIISYDKCVNLVNKVNEIEQRENDLKNLI